MILIIGGLGFVGSNTAQALLDVGEDCVLTQYKNDRVPEFLRPEVGKRIFIESADVTNIDELLALGKKHSITGIVHLVTGGLPAKPGASAPELVADVQSTIAGIANVVQAAQEWKVKRVTLASAPVVYTGVKELPWREDQLLPMAASFSMEVAKKCSELVSSYLGQQTQVECIQMRFTAMYGPNYDATRSSLIGRLVHAAVKGEKPSLEGMRFMSVHAADGGDQCYIKDAARGIALIQTADKLNHQVYNISSGHPVTNQAIVDAVKKVVPDFDIELPAGHMPGAPDALWYYDIARIREDTGFEPQFNIEAGVADYIAWLRAGNEQ